MSARLVDLTSPPAGPFRPGFWRSPLRGTRLTAILGLVLLLGLPVVIVTGLLSNDAYQPALGGNALGRNLGPLDFYLFRWPTRPVWLYALTQGLHVGVGLALFPVVVAKLWSVIPRLFEWPAVRSPAHALERISLALLVGGALFEFVTGILDIQYWYAFPFSFVQAHYYGAWVFIAAFLAHVALKLGTMRRALRVRAEVMTAVAGRARGPESPDDRPTGAMGSSEHGRARDLAPPEPATPTMSRRALLTAVGGASALLGMQVAGQAIGGPLREVAFLLPRGRTRVGGFPVNKTWAASGVAPRRVSGEWRLHLEGARSLSLSRAHLMALPQHSYDLPIACVEGWSTTQRWTGVRLRELAALCGIHAPATVTSQSLETGTYGRVTLGDQQIDDEQALLALCVNGRNLSLDHGFPARVIAPALPGVHCTKWVSHMTFRPLA